MKKSVVLASAFAVVSSLALPALAQKQQTATSQKQTKQELKHKVGKARQEEEKAAERAIYIKMEKARLEKEKKAQRELELKAKKGRVEQQKSAKPK